MKMKALVVLGLFGISFLFFAIGIFGVAGLWAKILFIDLTPLQHSWVGLGWVFGIALGSAFIAGVVMRTR